MRNLKRVLSLALALVMVLGMMVITTSAATYTDADEITFTEAVDVATGLGLFEGYDDGEMKPTVVLTREQAAALITRIMLGSYADDLAPTQQIFTDVATTRWSAAAIEYCYNIDMIDGLGDGTFDPTGELTGTAFAKLLLCALGYDAAAEGYTGADWKKNINADALAAGLTIDGVNIAAPCTREAAAQMILQALEADMVYYETYYDYATGAPVVAGPKAVLNSANKADYNQTHNTTNATIQFVENYFSDLVKTSGEDDDWGRPADHAWESAKTGYVYVNVMKTPVLTYTTEVSECDVAKALKLRAPGTVTYETLNGEPTDIAGAYIETVFNARYTIGAQGRLTEIYKTTAGYEIVYIDQFLAVVEDVTEVEYDKNGHIEAYATVLLTVYDAYESNVVVYDYVNFEYEVGDMLLVYYDDVDEIIEFVGYAESMVGAQTAYTTDPVHYVEDQEIPDAVQFNHDEAVTKTVDYTWYFDTYDNLIGSFAIRAKNAYGTISSIYWRDSRDGESGYAVATITYVDGTTDTEIVYSIDGNVLEGVELKAAVDYVAGYVSSTKQYNETYKVTAEDGTKVDYTDADYTNVALYKITTGTDGLELETVASLVDATIETGVPALGDDDGMNAGSSTKFLVWNGKTYETYTGIRNVPTYVDYDAAYYVDARHDGVADYIFVINPEDPTASTSVFYFWNTSLVTKTNLKKNVVDYYTVTGGYVNGEKASIVFDATTAGEAALADITNRALCSDVLLKLYIEDGYVVDYDVVTEEPTFVVINGVKYYAVYAGAVDNDTAWTGDDASLVDNVLMPVNGAAYDVEGLDNVITYNKGLAQTMRYDDDAYLYVVYTQSLSTGLKVAQTVYITDVEGNYSATATTVAECDEAVLYDGYLGIDITSDVVFNQNFVVALYDADGKQIGTTTLNTNKYGPDSDIAVGGISIPMYLDPTDYTGTTWIQDWTANKNVVPASYKLFVDNKVVASNVVVASINGDNGAITALTAEAWAALFA